jgi:hypothetical protein
MREPEEWPGDASSADELVVRVVRVLDETSYEERDTLLTDLLCAAWPTHRCQDQ